MPDPGFRPPQFPRGAPRKETRLRLILGAGTALVVATGLGAAACGSTESVQTQAQAQPSPTGMETGSPAPGATASPSQEMQGPFGAIHGQLVVPKPGGGYETVTTQTGVVTSISQSQVAVRSEDGFARTYAIDDNTRVCAGRSGLSGVTTGHKVWVISKGQGEGSRAIVLTDLTSPPWPPWAAAPGAGASPTVSPSPTGFETGSPSPPAFPTGFPSPGQPTVEPTG
ncbi:hypothetical protein Pth03_18030 [Planotetraspora thailandica]|uniref:DUF5666 domain-containing protein n=1 Tax=Planotetraspora thailandica TaxID=487172 RepID=A0A8J3V3K8_9ACTN|nr:hypothetical protein [Planotetraspora thailandica]GII53414.1 hypothetical protein Pth03_18030 [Planotetraspora thailandica]